MLKKRLHALVCTFTMVWLLTIHTYTQIVVIFLKLVTSLLLVRNYGNIICNIVNKYNRLISVSTLRKLEKLSLKRHKASLDIKFL